MVDFIDLYKVCKDYVLFVEKNMNSVITCNKVAKADSFEDFLSQIDISNIDIEHDTQVFNVLLSKTLAIKNPIRMELAEDIVKSVENTRDLMVDEDILPSESKSNNQSFLPAKPKDNDDMNELLDSILRHWLAGE